MFKNMYDNVLKLFKRPKIKEEVLSLEGQLQMFIELGELPINWAGYVGLCNNLSLYEDSNGRSFSKVLISLRDKGLISDTVFPCNLDFHDFTRYLLRDALYKGDQLAKRLRLAKLALEDIKDYDRSNKRTRTIRKNKA